jgi:hypothetical protein
MGRAPMDVRKKVLLDLFAPPGTLLPLVGGLTLLIGGWAVDAGAAVGFLGMVGILAGLGMAATRLIFGLEEITNRAYEYLHHQEWEKQQKALDKLDHMLVRDGDPRTQNALREVRLLYSSLVEDVKTGKITRNTHEILQKVEGLFRACVAQLERSYELWSAARRMSGRSRQRVTQQRDEVVREVIGSVEHLGQTIERLRGVTARTEDRDLGRLRDELDEAIEVARRTEQRLASWEKHGYSEEEFEQEGKT